LDCFVAEPVIGPRVRADPLAPRNDDQIARLAGALNLRALSETKN